MIVLKTGAELVIDGYKGIVLSEDKSQNISAFAAANGISSTEAKSVLESTPGFNEFINALLNPEEEQEDVTITDEFDETDTAQQDAMAKKYANYRFVKTLNEDGTSFTIGANDLNSYKFIYKVTGKTITIEAENCEFELTSIAKPGMTVVINGSNCIANIPVNLKSITNNADKATLNMNDSSNTIFNNGTNAIINGGKGNNTISNNKTATGSVINGGSGNDIIANVATGVTINGGDGNDTITNSSKATGVTINGDKGNDTIKNSAANIFINGGEGVDNIINGSSAAGSTIHGNEGNDIIDNTAQAVKIYGDQDVDTITNKANEAMVYGGAGNDSIKNSGRAVKIFGDEGDDYLENTAKEAVINGGLGNDNILNKGSSVVVNGNEGDDNITNKGSQTTINAGTGADNVVNSGSKAFLDGGEGADIITNSVAGITVVQGRNDTINGKVTNINVSVGLGDDGGTTQTTGTTTDGTTTSTTTTTGGTTTTTQPEANFENEILAQVSSLLSASTPSTLSAITTEKETVATKIKDLKAQLYKGDDYQDYLLEQKINDLNKRNTELVLAEEKLKAKAEGRSITNEELALKMVLSDIEDHLERITDKKTYLEDKINELSQSTDDSYADYVFEQQKNQVASMLKILEIDSTNMTKGYSEIVELYESLNQEPMKSISPASDTKKNYINAVMEKLETVYKENDIATQRSLAMQNEDTETVKELTYQQNSLHYENKVASLNLQQLFAKAGGKTVSDEDVTNLVFKMDLEYQIEQLETELQELEYKKIGIATKKLMANQTNDTDTIAKLSSEEAELNDSITSTTASIAQHQATLLKYQI